MPMGKQADRDEVTKAAGQVYEELEAWCATHPGYTLLELEEQAAKLRQRLIGEMMSRLVSQRESIAPAEGVKCPKCGEPMQNKGKRKRTVRGPEGPIELERAYYYCPACKEGFFPPRSRTATDEAALD
jgi:Zn finger protein HypA/HybF involved in hydrogenase expression